MKQEGRHIDFYASQAARRLDGDRRAQRITRWTLRRFWTPVGAGINDPADVRFMADYLFGDDGRPEGGRRASTAASTACPASAASVWWPARPR